MFATGYGGVGGPTIDVFKLGKLDAADVTLWKAHAAKATPAYTAQNVDELISKATNVDPSGADEESRCKEVAQKLIEMVGKGVWVPLEICIARPFIEHLMLSAVVAVAGRDTGATLFGPADMCATWNSNPNSYSMPFRSQI